MISVVIYINICIVVFVVSVHLTFIEAVKSYILTIWGILLSLFSMVYE